MFTLVMYCTVEGIAAAARYRVHHASLEPRPSSPRFYLVALEKNRGVRPGTISHVMRAADDV